jgi:hypothetical protein
MGVDVYAGELWIAGGGGRRATVPVGPDRPVADIWAGFQGALVGLGLDLDIWEKPQEVADVTPFSQNDHDRTLVPEQAQRFHRVLAATSAVLEEFRARFFGRSGVQLWWGGLDLSLLLFSGRRVPAPTDRGYIRQYDLDAEHLHGGFWAGDDATPMPAFSAYVTPRPAGCEAAPIEPGYASWVEEMGMWSMPYDEVRICADPRQAILDFLDSAYRAAVGQGGWSTEAHEYIRPPASPRG